MKGQRASVEKIRGRRSRAGVKEGTLKTMGLKGRSRGIRVKGHQVEMVLEVAMPLKLKDIVIIDEFKVIKNKKVVTKVHKDIDNF